MLEGEPRLTGESLEARSEPLSYEEFVGPPKTPNSSRTQYNNFLLHFLMDLHPELDEEEKDHWRPQWAKQLRSEDREVWDDVVKTIQEVGGWKERARLNQNDAVNRALYNVYLKVRDYVKSDEELFR